jgi:hypothetical protein
MTVARAVRRREDPFENCGFYTWEQWLAAVSGAGAFCMRNPHDPALCAPAAPRAYKHRRHRGS